MSHKPGGACVLSGGIALRCCMGSSRFCAQDKDGRVDLLLTDSRVFAILTRAHARLLRCDTLQGKNQVYRHGLVSGGASSCSCARRRNRSPIRYSGQKPDDSTLRACSDAGLCAWPIGGSTNPRPALAGREHVDGESTCSLCR